MKKMNPVVHFEMSAENSKRMGEFYSKVFGWHTNQLGEEMGHYMLVSTTDTDENGMVKTPGAINGGIYPREQAAPGQHHPSLVIGIDDIQQAMQEIKEAGGTIIGEPMEIPGYGTFVSFYDTEGNRVGMMQSNMDKI